MTDQEHDCMFYWRDHACDEPHGHTGPHICRRCSDKGVAYRGGPCFGTDSLTATETGGDSARQ